MLSPRPCNVYLALRRLTIFCVALGLTSSAALMAQTNNSSGASGNHTTSGSSHGSNNTSGSTGNHTSSGASQGSSSGASVGTSSGPKGGMSSGASLGTGGVSGASSTGNTSGAGAATGYLGRRGRSEGSSSGGNTSGGTGYPALPTEFIYDNSFQPAVRPGSGLFAPARPNPVTSGQAVGTATPAGQNAGQAGAQDGLPVVVVGPAGSSITSTPRLGFEPVEIPANEVALAIAERLRRLPALHFVTPVRVDLDGRTAILRGTVASGHDRDLAQRVVLLESAVDEVINLLDIAGQPETKNPPPPQPRS